VIYEIMRDEKTGREKIDMYKVVDHEKEFMGTLECIYKAEKANLSCGGGNPQKKGDWEYFVSGDTMRGSVVVGNDRTLYRKIVVNRTPGRN